MTAEDREVRKASMKWLLRLVTGPPKRLESGTFRRMTLVAFFAWVGLGADGLSSACYGPEEAFLELRGHDHLLIPLAALVVLTVAVISAGYSRVIELFPSGGGGYIVATRLLGKVPGLITGSALLLDYVLTITISIASGVAHIFSFLDPALQPFKLVAAVLVLAVLVILNLRGVKESIFVLMPIFLGFLVTHALMLGGVLLARGDALGPLLSTLPERTGEQIRAIGWWNTLMILMSAYTLGAGTFTGIEAVSNSMQILREPRVQTAKRTMLYMAVSLSLTAAGILLGYYLVGAQHVAGKTLNAVLFESVAKDWPLGRILVAVTLLAEGALLFVAAQAGFIGGPRSLATMAHDHWVPARFAHLSDRLVVADGVVLMGLAALAFLLATGGDVKMLVVLYATSVFITFVMSQLGMTLHWFRRRSPRWPGGFAINGLAFLLSSIILAFIVRQRFESGVWVTLAATVAISVTCVFIREHYHRVAKRLRELDRRLLNISLPNHESAPAPKDPNAPTAVMLVSGFNGLGVHAILTLHRLYPGHYKNFVLVSVGQVDFDRLQGEAELRSLRDETQQSIQRYERFVRALGGYFEARTAIAADVLAELERICLDVHRDFPRAVFFSGQLVFSAETPLTRLLHSYISYDLQRRLHLAGIPMMILPTKV